MSDANADSLSRDALLQMTTKVVTAYLGNNTISDTQISDVIESVYGSLENLVSGTGSNQTKQKPAVPIKRSITPDHIICLEDGKKLKMLKRYLRTTHGMSPDEYRIKWGLAADYPMVAPNYAKKRSAFAKEIGLGKRKT
ncbi:MAG: MucR family transcriptional regulator [Alphaproteobacteria bacterium]|nr:MucR family transcriptional regulator [Alphaproteobacteria bacterium]